MAEIQQPQGDFLQNDTLRQQLIAERDQYVLGELQGDLREAALDFLPRSGRVLKDAGENGLGTPISVGRPETPFGRLGYEIVTTAAQEIGVHVSSGDAPDKNSPLSQLTWRPSDNGSVLEYRYIEGPSAPSLGEAVNGLESKILAPFQQVLDEINSGSEQAQTEVMFDLDTNADLVATFMKMGNYIHTSSEGTGSRLTSELYDGLPVRYSGEEVPPTESGAGIYIDEHGKLLKVLVEIGERGVYRGMYFGEGVNTDPTGAEFKLGIEYDKRRARLEAGDQTKVVTEPFLDTKTGIELTDILQDSGLEPSSRLSMILAGIPEKGTDQGSKRYGNSYSELSREVAKFVNNPERSLESLFAGDVELARKKILDIDLANVENGPVVLLLGLLKDSISRDPDTEQASSVPVFNGYIRMKAGSCKDAEVKFTEALQPPKMLGQRMKNLGVADAAPGVKMLHKVDLGDPTAINPEPIWYKGVLLPAGSLFQRSINKAGQTEYAFVRVTSFTFDAEEGRDAFTWQFVDTMDKGGVEPTSNLLERRKYIWQ